MLQTLVKNYESVPYSLVLVFLAHYFFLIIDIVLGHDLYLSIQLHLTSLINIHLINGHYTAGK